MTEIEKIENYYNERIETLENSITETIDAQALINILEKAKSWDLFKLKCRQGGRKASKNLSKKERIDRARKASRSRECVQGKKKGRRTTKKSSI